MRRSHVTALVAALLTLWGVHAGSRALFGVSVFSSAERDSRRLEQAFPDLERMRVEDYRNQGWCRTLASAAGQFAETDHASTCVLFDGPTAAFTPAAERDFEAVERAFGRAGVPIMFFDAGYGPDGRLVRGTFHLSCFVCSRTRYVYEPGYGRVPPDEPDHMWFRPLSADWYRVEES